MKQRMYERAYELGVVWRWVYMFKFQLGFQSLAAYNNCEVFNFTRDA